MTLEYVLITPAHNEADHIGLVLRSVIAQTHRPLKWVIVSDGSTDGTEDIVREAAAGQPWIELVSLSPRRERNFAAKVHAVRTGLERMAGLDYEVLGNLDGDVSFEADYMAFLLERFAAMPRLGVAGTHYIEGEFHSFRDSYISAEHVNGQCQMFRLACWHDIGGYQPIAGGGIDWVAVTTARMKGWTTRSFSERVFHHHRKMGTAGSSELRARFHYGKKDYWLGGHWAWHLARCAFQLARRPYVVGGLALLAGYCWQGLSGRGRSVSPQLQDFHQLEQLQRLRHLVRRGFRVERGGGAHDARPAA